MMLNYDDTSIYMLILKVGAKYGVDPSMSIASEEFFRRTLAEYKGDKSQADILRWLEDIISSNFLAFDQLPEWIQEPEWPFTSGQPMIFVGQVNVKRNASIVAQNTIHDDTSYYVFIPQERGTPQVIIQQY